MISPVFGSPSSALAGLFPVPQVDEVLRYVVDSWRDLIGRWPAHHSFKKREEALTKSLKEHLNVPERLAKSGLPPGRFQCEIILMKRLSSGAIKEIGRTDIQYDLLSQGAPSLIIEFKKLNCKQALRHKYCKQGIKRFVDGEYAAEQQVAAMCGFVYGTAAVTATEVKALETYLSKARVAKLLACHTTPTLAKPSLIAPKCASFDSKHSRAHLKNEIALTHFFVECPG